MPCIVSHARPSYAKSVGGSGVRDYAIHALLDFWIVAIAIPAGSASFMYTEFKKICAFQYVCNELVIEYFLVHAYYLEAFPYILYCAYVIEPQFPVLLFS